MVLVLNTGWITGCLATTTCSFPNIGTTMEVTATGGTLTWVVSEITRFVRSVESKGASAAGAAYGADFAVKGDPEDLQLDDFPAPEDLPDDIVADMVRAIREGRPVQCDGREGLKSVALFEAIYASSDAGDWIEPARP